jgi:hypothetical protein
MIRYKTQSLVLGYKLGLKAGAKYVAVPSKSISKKEETYVLFQGSNMVIKPNDTPEKHTTFDDKFGRGSYVLNYYEWKPDNSLFSNS